MKEKITYIKCPNCGGELSKEKNPLLMYKRDLCLTCGFYHKINYDEENRVISQKKVGGYGLYACKFGENSLGHEMGSFETEEEVEEFKKRISTNKDKKPFVVFAYYTSYNPTQEKWEKVWLIGDEGSLS